MERLPLQAGGGWGEGEIFVLSLKYWFIIKMSADNSLPPTLSENFLDSRIWVKAAILLEKSPLIHLWHLFCFID
jgi:hypothetical protein